MLMSENFLGGPDPRFIRAIPDFAVLGAAWHPIPCNSQAYWVKLPVSEVILATTEEPTSRYLLTLGFS